MVDIILGFLYMTFYDYLTAHTTCQIEFFLNPLCTSPNIYTAIINLLQSSYVEHLQVRLTSCRRPPCWPTGNQHSHPSTVSNDVNLFSHKCIAGDIGKNCYLQSWVRAEGGILLGSMIKKKCLIKLQY